MNQSDFDKVTAEMRQKCEEIVGAKRPAYTGASPDVLENFKWVGGTLGLTPMQVWGVLFLKHISALASFVKDPRIPQGEALDGRFADAHNYLDLGYAILRETLDQAVVDERVAETQRSIDLIRGTREILSHTAANSDDPRP